MLTPAIHPPAVNDRNKQNLGLNSISDMDKFTVTDRRANVLLDLEPESPTRESVPLITIISIVRLRPKTRLSRDVRDSPVKPTNSTSATSYLKRKTGRGTLRYTIGGGPQQVSARLLCGQSNPFIGMIRAAGVDCSAVFSVDTVGSHLNLTSRVLRSFCLAVLSMSN